MTRALATRPSGFFGTPRRLVDLKRLRAAAAHPRFRALARSRAAEAPLEEAASARPTAAAAISPEQRLLQRISFGPTTADAARIRQIGYQRYLDEQLNYQALDDSELDAVIAEALPTLSMTPAQLYFGENFDLTYELPIAAIVRAIYTKRQLFETMVHFWTDHFNIDLLGDTAHFLKQVDERDVIRKHALGKFPDMLRASSKSTAMLTYLTNDSNYAGSPNENYAREIMELHSLGADQGYTQQDVRELARCFTGWFYVGEDDPANFGKFRFEVESHDQERKRVLGTLIPLNGGVRDAETIVDLLGRHPNTAKYIARKLLIYFWGYEPPITYVNQVAAVYRQTGGDIKAMLRAILKQRWIEAAKPKLKRPFHYVVSAVRALYGQADNPSYLYDALSDAGHVPYYWSPPNGYPDNRQYWSGFLRNRWNFALELASGETGINLNLDAVLDPRQTPQALATKINALVANGTLGTATLDAIRNYLRGGERTTQRVREALALAISSPEFQEF